MPLLSTTGAASAKGFGFLAGSAGVANPGNINLSSISFVRVRTLGFDSTLGLTFKPDGTTLYVTRFSPGTVYQYNLSTPWDISTTSLFTSIDLNQGNLSDIQFSQDGLNMFVVERATNFVILKYTLGTAWNLNSISYNSSSNLTLANLDGLYRSADGLNFMVQSQTGDCPFVTWYSASANNITSLTARTALNIKPLTGGQLTSVLGFGMSSDGKYYYAPQFDSSGWFYKIQLNTPFRSDLGGTYLGRIQLPNGSGPTFGNLDQVYINETLKFMYIADYNSPGRIWQFSYQSM